MFLLSPHAEIVVGLHVQEEFERIRFKFAIMFKNVMEELTKGVELDTIKELFGFWDPDLKTELDAVQTMKALIAIVRDNCSFTNYSILTELAQELKNNSALSEIKAYTKERDEYYGRVLAEDFAKVAMEKAESVPSGHIEVTTIPYSTVNVTSSNQSTWAW